MHKREYFLINLEKFGKILLQDSGGILVMSQKQPLLDDNCNSDIFRVMFNRAPSRRKCCLCYSEDVNDYRLHCKKSHKWYAAIYLPLFKQGTYTCRNYNITIEYGSNCTVHVFFYDTRTNRTQVLFYCDVQARVRNRATWSNIKVTGRLDLVPECLELLRDICTPKKCT